MKSIIKFFTVSKPLQIDTLGKQFKPENIINRQPRVITFVPENETDFNRWAYSLNVSSRVPKVR